MKRRTARASRAFALLAVATFVSVARGAAPPDPRHIANGLPIPTVGYADQPYVVKTDDGAWLLVVTTGAGHEGAPGQHVVSMRTTDRGATWSDVVAVEPAGGPEASYAVALKAPSGRIYVFYNHNTDRVPEVKREDGGVYKRVDSLGYYVFKFSDDHGRTWSDRRHVVPVREFACDRENVYGGAIRFFWNVGRPLVRADGTALLTLHKVGAMGAGFFAQSEGVFLRSDNLLTETDPEKIRFETLPEGDVGLRTPAGGGRVAEEQSVVELSDGSLYCVYRTVDGWPACAYSRDGGRTWTPPAYASYAPGGRRIKNPRAANFVWKTSGGRYLYWFHNHGGPAIAAKAADLSGRSGSPFDDRNPAWLAAGVERDSPDGKVLHWSQPEILLYDDDPWIRTSYPDLVEEDGRFYATETQKNVGRIHEIPPALVEGLFGQFENRVAPADSILLDLSDPDASVAEVPMPKLPEFHARDATRPDYGSKDLRAGFSIEFRVSPGAGELARTTLLDSRTEAGAGILVEALPSGSIRIAMNDGRQEAAWESDRGAVRPGETAHVVVVADGGPKIVSFVVDGVLLDGGDERQFGWGRFSPTLRAPNGGATIRVAPEVAGLRVFGRALRTSEAVGAFRAWKGE